MWSQLNDGPKTFFIFDGDLLIGEVQVDGTTVTPIAAYTWGASGPVSERLLPTSRSLWYHFGPQGETRQLTDSSGAIADRYIYTAYGVPGPTTGADRNPFRFGGQVGYYTDASSCAALILCGARWYSPDLARWISRDPIGYQGGPNLYEYCGGDPVGGLDPSGTQDCDQRAGDDVLEGIRLDNVGNKPFGAFSVHNPGSIAQINRGAKVANEVLKGVGNVNPIVNAIIATGRDPYTAHGRVRTWEQGLSIVALAIPALGEVRFPGAGMFFSSAGSLERALGSPGTGNVWHHLVEQCRTERFGAKLIQNRMNVVAVPNWVNVRLNAIYSGYSYGITGMRNVRVRDWLAVRSYGEQWAFGLQALHNVLAGKW